MRERDKVQKTDPSNTAPSSKTFRGRTAFIPTGKTNDMRVGTINSPTYIILIG
jgi:hypothetical protein